MRRSFERGYKAGLAGKGREDCPYVRPKEYSDWIDGWKEALAEMESN